MGKVSEEYKAIYKCDWCGLTDTSIHPVQLPDGWVVSNPFAKITTDVYCSYSCESESRETWERAEELALEETGRIYEKIRQEKLEELNES